MAIYQFQNDDKNNMKSERLIGIILLVISSFAFLFLFTNLVPFMKRFLLGILGLFAYPLFITTFTISIALVNNKKYVLSKKYVVFLSLATICLLGIIQLIILGKPSIGFFEYLGLCYSYKMTAGGILIGLITAPLIYVLDLFGAYIILSLGLIIFVALVIDYLYYVKNNAKSYKGITIKTKKVFEEKPAKFEILQSNNLNKPEKEKVKITLDAKIEHENQVENDEEENQAKIKLGLIEGNLKPKKPEKKPENVYQYILTPPEVDLSAYSYSLNRENKSQEINNAFSMLKQENKMVDMTNVNPSKPAVIVHDETPSFVKTNHSMPAYIEPLEELKEEIEEEANKETTNDDFTDEVLKNILDDKKPIVINPEPIAPQLSRRRNFSQLEMDGMKTKTPEQKPAKIYSKPPTYVKPPLELLTTTSVDLSTLNEDVVGKRMQLENALDMFGIPAKVIGVVVGPSVTRYELEMPPGISVKKIIAHSDDIALALAAKGDIRIEAPIPGKSAVGVEVPNEKIATVSMKEILNSPEFINSKSPLTFALGKDISGNVKICNLQKMPHLLVAGATNSGKSVCLNAIIISLIYKSSPEDVKLILVDPKRVEFALYNSLPHLLLPNVITEADKAINAFTWAVNEMERRFEIFMEHRVRNLEEYNDLESVKKCEAEKLPYIVIIVDELADLMMTAKKEAEEKIMRLAQKARACGIHLILATQRPSIDVITGTIKANFPSRISFSVTSFQDSRTILDQGGAEKLLGKGDMLYAPSDAAEPKRIQGCFVSGSEVEEIVNFVKENNHIEFDEKAEKEINNLQKSNHQGESENGTDVFDSLMPDALKLVIEMGQASISLIQRRLVVGYPRAARIIDQMEKANFISPSDGSKPRTVYLTMEKYEELFGNKND